jgi:hypothetical protein
MKWPSERLKRLPAKSSEDTEFYPTAFVTSFLHCLLLLRTWEWILQKVGGHVGPGRRHRRTVGAPGRIELDKGPPAVYVHPLIKIRRCEANNRVRIDRMDRCNSEHKYSHVARGRHCVSLRTEAYSTSSEQDARPVVNSWHCVCFLLVHLLGGAVINVTKIRTPPFPSS